MEKDGTFIIQKDLVDQWCKQAITPYHELTEQEKDSHRYEAGVMIKIFDDFLNRLAGK